MGWAATFGIPWTEERTSMAATVRALAAFGEELDRSYLSLGHTAYQKEDYESAYAAIRNASLIQVAVQSIWDAVLAQFRGPSAAVVRMCSRYVPPSEALTSDEDYLDLVKTVAEFKTMLADYDTNDPLVAFLLGVHRRMETALVEYQIIGEAALVERVFELEGALAHAVKSDPAMQKNPVWIASASLLQKVKTVLQATVLAAAAMKASQTIGVIAAETVDYYVEAPAPRLTAGPTFTSDHATADDVSPADQELDGQDIDDLPVTEAVSIPDQPSP
jgi:hypothetical protein